MVGYELKDTIEGDGDGRPDAGEVIALYPTFRNDWGQVENLTFSLEIGENEDPTIVEILDDRVSFGKPLSSYAKAKSANPIRFKVNPDCVDGRHIRLVLRATCDNITEEFEQEFVVTVENGVEIGGMITEDMTLYPNVHYIVTSNLAVPQNVTLTIKPGTVLKIKDGVGISVSGNLVCNGTPDSLIVLTKTDLGHGNIGQILLNNRMVSYVKIVDLNYNNVGEFFRFNGENCIVKDCSVTYYFSQSGNWESSNIYNNYMSDEGFSRGTFINCNFINNSGLNFDRSKYGSFLESRTKLSKNCNTYGNWSNYYNNYANAAIFSEEPLVYKCDIPNYYGASSEINARKGIIDMHHSTIPVGFGLLDLSNMLTRPSAEAHGIVWKVVVNGYDAQDEFEQLPPLGVGRHKFEVYFNRPMNKEAVPFIAMGVRPPYTQNAITEEGRWNDEGTIYTAYLTITGKTGTDGLNRIYVSGAEDDEFFEIPVENTRFNVEVAATGSMATGLMAEAGLGKVTLTWETDEEDFADLLGYNIYRYTEVEDSMCVGGRYDENWNWLEEWRHFTRMDTIIVNSSVIDSEETSFVDYDVVPGNTYYYVIKQLTTSLNSHALSNAVAATPLTASKGDANGSMSVDIADVVTEVAYITYQDPQPFIFEAADVNSDSKVNVLDVVGTIGIITNPSGMGVSGMDNEPVRYFVTDGKLYVETAQALGGVQVRLNVAKGTEITALDGLKGMEQNGTWTSDNEYLFLAYSMSGQSIPAGTHALLQIGDEAVVIEVVLSDVKGKNITAVNGNATGIGKVEAVQMQMPSPNPFTTVLHVPYTIGKSGSHEVSIVFSDMAGRAIDAYHTVKTQGEYSYTWYPKALQKGLYLVSLYLDGELMQTVKVVRE